MSDLHARGPHKVWDGCTGTPVPVHLEQLRLVWAEGRGLCFARFFVATLCGFAVPSLSRGALGLFCCEAVTLSFAVLRLERKSDRRRDVQTLVVVPRAPQHPVAVSVGWPSHARPPCSTRPSRAPRARSSFDWRSPSAGNRLPALFASLLNIRRTDFGKPARVPVEVCAVRSEDQGSLTAKRDASHWAWQTQ